MNKKGQETKTQSIQSDFSQGVFAGSNGIREFLAPDNHPPLPLVELPVSLNPFKKDAVRIFAKLLTSLPGGQVKSGTAYEMFKALEEQGRLKDIQTIIEASSGNTVSMETLFASHFGEHNEKKTVAIVIPGTSIGKIQLLQLLGVHVMIATEGIKKAKEEGKKKGVINPSQYDNPANPDFFYKIIGPQLWKQTNGTVTLLCAGLGSGGTMMGTAKYLKEKNSKIQTLGVIINDGDSVPGVRTLKRLEEVLLPWEDFVDYRQFVSAKDSYKKSIQLIRKAALLAGPSSGFALQGLLQELQKMKEEKTLDTIRNENGEVVAVFIVPDGPLAYISDYFTHLDPSFFHPVIS